MKGKGVYFHNFNTLRFIAAMMVFGHHVVLPYIYIELPQLAPVFKTIFSGNSGVSFFFVLSGFLITYLLFQEKENKGSVAILPFYGRRISRIWPLYFIVLFFSLVAYPLFKLYQDSNYSLAYNPIKHFFFLSNFDILDVSLNSPKSTNLFTDISWSIGIEEQFYLVWPIVFLLRRKYFPFIAIMLVIGSMLFRYLNHSDYFVLKFHTLSTIVDLAMGGLFAYFGFYNYKFKNWFANFTLKGQVFVFMLPFVLIFLIENRYFNTIGFALIRFVLALVFALLIAQQGFNKLGNGIEAKNWRYADKLGVITYGVYLLHPIVLWGFGFVYSYFSVEIDIIFVVLAYFATIYSAKFSFHYIESYFLKLGKKKPQ